MLTSLLFFSVLALPPPSRDPCYKQIFKRLNVVEAEERSIKFLLNDELLHQLGLLHPSRSTQLCEVPDSPAKAEKLMPKDPSTKTLLVKCPILTDVAGPSSNLTLAPVIEEEEPPQSSGRSADEGVEKASPKKHDGDDVFEGLSDLIVTSQELFKDDVSKTISPVIEATSPLHQMPTPPTQVITTSTPQSGL